MVLIFINIFSYYFYNNILILDYYPSHESLKNSKEVMHSYDI